MNEDFLVCVVMDGKQAVNREVLSDLEHIFEFLECLLARFQDLRRADNLVLTENVERCEDRIDGDGLIRHVRQKPDGIIVLVLAAQNVRSRVYCICHSVVDQVWGVGQNLRLDHVLDGLFDVFNG